MYINSTSLLFHLPDDAQTLRRLYLTILQCMTHMVAGTRRGRRFNEEVKRLIQKFTLY